ncbi:hypothetical protein OF001_U130059 [Pseudomonas sp. OF001]|nr:hypothetical protein OF001_U130059 [Pseudomonas sp. OF001]
MGDYRPRLCPAPGQSLSVRAVFAGRRARRHATSVVVVAAAGLWINAESRAAPWSQPPSVTIKTTRAP